MAIYSEIDDLDKRFRELSQPPVIVNNVDIEQRDAIENLNKLLYVRYQGDSLSIVPTCTCQRLMGEENFGIRCSHCGDTVMDITERPLESTLWLTTPPTVKALINPIVYIILRRATSSGKNYFNCIDWLINPSYRPKKTVPAVEKLIELGFTGPKRDLNYFIENFDEIMHTLATTRTVKNKDGYLVNGNKRTRMMLLEFIKRYRDRIFCQYIPIPSRYCFVSEISGGITYVDTDFLSCIDAVRTIAMIRQSEGMSERSARSKTAKAIGQLGDYYTAFFERSIHSKNGWYRQHVFGTRSHFSGRAVITSIHEAHRYDEIHLPWALAVSLYKYHLVNKLRKRKMSPNEINRYLFEHTAHPSQLLIDIFDELIRESPYIGLPCVLHRNPSLDLLSAQQLFITHIKPDITDNTIGVSTLVLVAWNADFDGDQLNLMALNDVKMTEATKLIRPHNGVLDINKPRSLSGNITIPAPMLSTLGNYLSGNYRKKRAFVPMSQTQH